MKQLKKYLKSIGLFLITIFMLVSSLSLDVLAETSVDPALQVTYEGKTIENVNNDKVNISKTITQSIKENFFDITLKVETETYAKNITVDPDIAVVLVLDTSVSMTWCTTPGANGRVSQSTCSTESDKRINVAKEAIYDFTEIFFANKSSKANRELALVTFNKDASEVVNFSDDASTSKEKFDSKVRKLGTSSGTNLGEGLAKGKQLLDSTTIKNKYLIVLTDGYPTVYGNPGGSIASNSYGNQAGIYAAEKAAINRDAGIKTFVIGVGLNSQVSFNNINTKYAVGYTTSKSGYSSRETYTTTPNHFKLWLGGKVVKGSPLDANGNPTDLTKVEDGGIGYVGDMRDANNNPVSAYYDAESMDALLNAYTSIFAEIEREVDILNKAWTATDPMNDTASELPDYIGFENFYNSENRLVDSLTLTNSNNIATYDAAKDSIIWNLRESDPVDIISLDPTDESKVKYVYELKYRIRLKNELSGFEEWASLPTNGNANLTYALADENNEIKELKTVYFPIPEVRGYLGNLEFTKTDEDGNPLEGGIFYLIHDDDCDCKKYSNNKNEKEYMMQEKDNNGKPKDKRYIATSDSQGKVKFTNIPSGHKYKLVEAQAPTNYKKSNYTYEVTVDYDSTVANIPNYKFINTHDVGYIIVRKLITDTHIDSSKEFSFKLIAKDGTYNTILVDDNNEEIVGTGSTISANEVFKLKHNDAIKIQLVAGTEYEIQEIDNEEYDVTYTNNKGNVIQQDIVSVKVENKTKPKTIKAQKIWKNTDGYINYPTVTLTLFKKAIGETEWTNVEDVILTKNNNWYYEWKDLEGDYEYKVDEVNVPELFLKDVKYNGETYTFEITNTSTVSYKLPKAGSSSMLIMVLMSISMILFSFVYGCVYYYKSRVQR